MITPTDNLEAVLSKTVQWGAHSSARLISDADVECILRFDKRDADTRRALLEEVSAIDDVTRDGRRVARSCARREGRRSSRISWPLFIPHHLLCRGST